MHLILVLRFCKLKALQHVKIWNALSALTLKEDKISKLSLEKKKNIIDQIDPLDKQFKYVTFSQYNEPLIKF